MKLYHWTAAHLIEGIKRDGLTRGRTPFFNEETNELDFLEGHIWLTSDGNYESQKWAIPVSINYSRRAWRIEVNIPGHRLGSVWSMKRVCEMLGDGKLPGFDDHPEMTDYWYVHMGAIPRQYFKQIRCMTGGSK
jgi:hypothetical protein